jgi:hypothetical protein
LTSQGGGWADDSRPAHPLERDWRCSWPQKARAAAIFEERVHVIVQVSAVGRAERVDLLDDPQPGLGFREAAAACAMRQRYEPARDARGAIAAGKTNRFAVIFYLY